MRKLKLYTATRPCILITLLMLTGMSAKAQFYGIRADILGLAAAQPEVEVSMTLSHKLSLHLPVRYSPFVWKENAQARNFTVEPHLRWWFKESYRGWFMGTNAHFSRYHIAGVFDKYRYEGSAGGAGLSAGKSVLLGRHWNFEWEVGAGMVYTRYDRYLCKRCGRHLGRFEGWQVIPMRWAVGLVYLF